MVFSKCAEIARLYRQNRWKRGDSKLSTEEIAAAANTSVAYVRHVINDLKHPGRIKRIRKRHNKRYAARFCQRSCTYRRFFQKKSKPKGAVGKKLWKAWTTEDLRQARRMQLEESLTHAEIAEKLGRTFFAVGRALNRMKNIELSDDPQTK